MSAEDRARIKKMEREYLQSWIEDKGDSSIKAPPQAVKREARFKRRFHSLRTYAATEFAKLSPTNQELMDRFGHRDIKTAMRYQRTTGRDAELLRKLS